MNTRTQILRLGSRASPLAMVQTRLVLEALETRWPDLKVQIIPMSTRGDRDQHTPLRQVEDPDFFSDSLNGAVRRGEIHACVHSLKDVGLESPAGIYRLPVLERSNPREAILFRGDIMERLAGGIPLRIGTSSDRRRENTGEFLQQHLPQTGPAPRLRFHDLRGPVDQRVLRISGDPRADGALDGVVMALAGLERLWLDGSLRAVLGPILSRVRWMIAPLEACPAAPGQAILAADCRSEDGPTRRLLESIQDPQTTRLAESEHRLWETLPRAQRQHFGISAVEHATWGRLVHLRSGSRSASPGEQRTLWNQPPRPPAARPWDGRAWSILARRENLPVDSHSLERAPALFLAHWRTLNQSAPIPDAGTRIWTSGLRSWKQLARRGLWVEGCAEETGFNGLLQTLASPVLQLPELARWTVLTHEAAVSSWTDSGVGRVLATYRVGPPRDANKLAQLRASVRRADHFYWPSASAWQACRSWVPAGAHHACGLGKTAEHLRGAGLTVEHRFPSRQEWQQWLA